MGIVTDGTLFKATGEEKVQTRGAGIMRDMFKDMKRDDFMGRDGFLANGAATIKGAQVTAGTGRVVVIKRGIHGVGGVLLAADEVSAVVVMGFEGRTKIQDKCYNVNLSILVYKL